jgi:hypothetical protein
VSADREQREVEHDSLRRLHLPTSRLPTSKKVTLLTGLHKEKLFWVSHNEWIAIGLCRVDVVAGQSDVDVLGEAQWSLVAS